jgi:restriction system protein
MTDAIESGSGVSTIAQWHTFLHPILRVLSNGQTWAKRDMETAVLDEVGLSEVQRAELLPSGQSRALNRIGWATSALRRAKALTSPSRGSFAITATGHELLTRHPQAITVAHLEQVPAYTDYVPTRHAKHSASPHNSESESVDDQTPQDLIRAGIDAIEDDVKAKLLERLRGGDPYFFEFVVRRLLVAMGYGVESALARLPGSGDGGIDGVIDRDELGLNKIYIQAKRYAEENSIGRPNVQEFVGALATRGASVGVFFTTSRFSAEANDAVGRVAQDIALVDGLRLAELMIRHKVGVEVSRTVDIVRIDENFFSDE